MPRNKPRTRVGGTRTHTGNGGIPLGMTTKALQLGRIGSQVKELLMNGVEPKEIDAFIRDVYAGKWGSQLTGAFPPLGGPMMSAEPVTAITK